MKAIHRLIVVLIFLGFSVCYVIHDASSQAAKTAGRMAGFGGGFHRVSQPRLNSFNLSSGATLQRSLSSSTYRTSSSSFNRSTSSFEPTQTSSLSQPSFSRQSTTYSGTSISGSNAFKNSSVYQSVQNHITTPKIGKPKMVQSNSRKSDVKKTIVNTKSSDRKFSNQSVSQPPVKYTKMTPLPKNNAVVTTNQFSSTKVNQKQNLTNLNNLKKQNTTKIKGQNKRILGKQIQIANQNAAAAKSQAQKLQGNIKQNGGTTKSFRSASNTYSSNSVAQKLNTQFNPPKLKKTLQIKTNNGSGKNREMRVRERLGQFKSQPVQHEQYLRTSNGKIAKDPITGKGRRVDHVVMKNGKARRVLETTSLTADKEKQVAKEFRIRNNGGTFIRDRETGKLVDISKIPTKLIRIK